MADWEDDPAFKSTPHRGMWERFKDSYMSSALHNPFGAEGAMRYLGIGRPAGMTDDQLNEAERRLSDHYAQRQEADPIFQGGDPRQSVLRGAVDLVGGLLGGVDPSYLLAPGASAVKRIAAQGAINAGMDAASQGVELHRNVRDSFDPSEVAMNAAAGAVFQGGGEVHSRVKLGRDIRNGMKHPEWQAVNDVIVNDLEGGGTLAHPNVSKKGAMGPQQVMPETARDPGFGIRPWDGKSQADLARVGRQYSAAMMNKYDGDPAKVLAAYNAGPGRVDAAIKKHGENWFDYIPNETKDYVSHGVTKLGRAANDVADLQRGFPRPHGRAEQPIHPENLGDIDLVRQEQASLDEQSRANDTLAPEVDFEQQPFIFDKQSGEWRDESEIETFRRHKEEDAFRKRAEEIRNGGPLIVDNLPEEYLTPAERQDMDASAEKPIVDNTGYEKHTPYVGDPKAAANDPKKKGFVENFKDMLKDDSGSLNNDEPLPEPDVAAMSPEEKLGHAINTTRPASLETKELVSTVKKAQAKRLAEIQARGGSLPEQLSALKGELPSADYESIAHHFSPEEKTALKNKINSFKGMAAFDKLNAHKALDKMLSEEGMKMPTEHELDLLADVFSPKVIKALVERQKGAAGINEKIANIGGIPRTIMSSTDISAPARQGLLFVGRKEFWQNYPKMIKMFFDKDYYETAMHEIKERPNYQLMRRGKLAVRDSAMLIDREEYFVSNIAETMPGNNIFSKAYNKTAGAVIRGSDRAYSGFLRKLRADVFDTMIEKGRAKGIDWESSPQKVKALGNFINTSTGRGDLGKFEAASQAFSTVFFAPRLMKARFDILNPVYYGKLYHADPMIAKEAFKAMGSTVAFAGTALALAVAGGATVEGDLRSADGLKIKIGNVRIDILGGIQQYLHLIAQMASGEKKTQGGDLQSLTDGKYGHDSRLDVLGRFLANKFAPVPGLARDYLKGKDPTGADFSWKKELSDIVTPMDISDTIDALKTDGKKSAWVALPAFLGAGVQTYAPKESKGKAPKEDSWESDPAFGGAPTSEKASSNWEDDPVFGAKQ